jgi:hypothetical protein
MIRDQITNGNGAVIIQFTTYLHFDCSHSPWPQHCTDPRMANKFLYKFNYIIGLKVFGLSILY